MLVFIDKIAGIRHNIQLTTGDPAGQLNYNGLLSKFTPISITFLNDTVKQLKPTGSPLDTIPARLFNALMII